MSYPRNTQYLGNELRDNYNMCSSENRSKPRNKGINGVYVGVKLLYKYTRKRHGQQVRRNDLAFQMNFLVTKVLVEVLLGVCVKESNFIRNRGKRRRSRRRTMTSDQVLGRNRLFGCHSQETLGEEKKKSKAEEYAQERKKKEVQCIVMHEHVTCKPKLHHRQNPIQTTTLTRYNQSHSPRMQKTSLFLGVADKRNSKRKSVIVYISITVSFVLYVYLVNIEVSRILDDRMVGIIDNNWARTLRTKVKLVESCRNRSFFSLLTTRQKINETKYRLIALIKNPTSLSCYIQEQPFSHRHVHTTFIHNYCILVSIKLQITETNNIYGIVFQLNF